MFDATYVDDEAIYLSARSPDDLLRVFRRAVRVLDDVFAEAGFVINWLKVKLKQCSHSEVLVLRRPLMGCTLITKSE